MSTVTVDRIIAKFGTQRALAAALGVDQSSVSGWRRRGSIPARRQAQLLEVAAARGIDLSPAEFFEAGGAGEAASGPAPAWPRAASEAVLLTVAEMGRADAAAIRGGTSGETLMGNAGAAIAEAIRARWSPRPVAVLCGPGNNGGDGFVVARKLAAAGWPVRLALAGPLGRLRGDAALHAGRWQRPIERLSPAVLDGRALVVDALFGAGLTRPLEGAAREVVEAVNARRLACVAVDVPSGVDGDSGAVLGAAPDCALTVTFFRPKPGHLLLPGRLKAGDLAVADIGIPAAVLDEIGPSQYSNGPALWLDRYPWPRLTDHKYSRGHVVVAGGGAMTGAARLAARGAMRAGAGLVTIAAPPEAVPIYASYMPGVLTAAAARPADFRAVVGGRRIAAALVGPGNGVGDATRANVLSALATGKPCVVDADGLSVFEGDPDALAGAVRGPCVLTPHEGEFARLFGAGSGEAEGSRLVRARAAAARLGAVVILKGGDTVIAAPDGRAAINANAPAVLATGGSGDVLAGIAAALMGQGMAAFDAACAAVWVHGAAAAEVGPGLIAEDLPEALPAVLRRLRAAAGAASGAP